MTTDVALVGASKAYRGVPAVDDVSLDVPTGSFFSLLGPSGCGKTTILRMIAGFVEPDAGDIFIRGVRMNRKPPYRRDTALVFQGYALFPHMNVFDNVAFGLRYRGIRPKDRAAKVSVALDRVRLAGLEFRRPSQLSGGQQQRVALARAIVTEPALLLLDEPLSNLDLRLRQQMRQELRNIQKDLQITTIYVTHDQGEAFSMSDQIAVMDKGRVVQSGSPEDIFLRPSSEYVLTFIGETNKFSCEIVGTDQGTLLLLTDDGLTFRANGSAADASNHPLGARRRLFFREEQAAFVRASSAANSFPGVVTAIENLGSMTTYTARLSTGAEIRATMATSSAKALVMGAAIFAEVDPSDCILVSVD